MKRKTMNENTIQPKHIQPNKSIIKHIQNFQKQSFPVSGGRDLSGDEALVVRQSNEIEKTKLKCDIILEIHCRKDGRRQHLFPNLKNLVPLETS
jgi:hypothetical protein